MDDMNSKRTFKRKGSPKNNILIYNLYVAQKLKTICPLWNTSIFLKMMSTLTMEKAYNIFFGKSSKIIIFCIDTIYTTDPF